MMPQWAREHTTPRPMEGRKWTFLRQTLEEKIAHIDSKMLDPEVYSDHEQCRQLQQEKVRLQQELEPLEFEWTRRADQVD